MKVIWLHMVSGFPSITMGWRNLKICQNFVVTKFFPTFVAGKTSMGGVKNIWVSNIYYYITTLSYFISSETANTQKSEIFLLRISSGNLDASVVTCRYPQITQL